MTLKVSKIYDCIVTGDADSLTDITIPISSLDLDENQTGISSLTIVCPDGLNFASSILARPNGGLILSSYDLYSDGSSALEKELDEFLITSISDSSGASSHSVSITGQVEILNPSPKTENIIGESFIFTNKDGTVRIRGSVNMLLLPGDTLTYSGGSFTVDKIAINIRAESTSSTMEVSSG